MFYLPSSSFVIISSIYILSDAILFIDSISLFKVTNLSQIDNSVSMKVLNIRLSSSHCMDVLRSLSYFIDVVAFISVK